MSRTSTRAFVRRAAAIVAATALAGGTALISQVAPAGAGDPTPVGPCGNAGVFSSTATTRTCTYSYTGSADSFIPPAGIASYTVEAYGAQGGSTKQESPWNVGGVGGKGARVTATVSSASLTVYVGQGGNNGMTSSAGGTNPFFGDFGGGSGGTTGNAQFSLGHGAGGGAATLVEGFTADFFMVAGGGGGGGTFTAGSAATGGGNGGAGGDPNGAVGGEGGSSCCSQSGTDWNLDGGNGGNGGTPTTAGTGGAGGGGTVSGGSFLAGNTGGTAGGSFGRIGGAGAGGQNSGGHRTSDGGGGGGGVKGGGGGGSGSGFSGTSVSGGSGGGGGGGGASQGPAGAAFTSGAREGNGQVVVTWSIPSVTATNDSYSTPMNTNLVEAAPGVLGNDSPSGATAVKVTDPTNGTVTLNSDGSFTYSPTNGYTGSDSFTYKATKADFVDSAPATVNITVANPVDLSLGKTCGPDPVVPGDTVTCTLTVTNGGSAAASNVVVTDDLPAGLSQVAFGATGGYTCATQVSGPEISCTKASEVTGSSTITYTAVVSPDLGPATDLTNSAVVTSASTDADSDDQAASDTVSTPTCTIDRRTAISNQTIKGTSGPDVICGSPFDDIITAGGDGDVVFAGGGRDDVAGDGGADRLFGGAANDKLVGDNGNDKLYGGDGNDTLKGNDGNDSADGRAGTDFCGAETTVRCE